MSQILHSQLGRTTDYPTRYDASLLFAVPRRENRAHLPAETPLHGCDVWTGYELSWLNADGLPQVAIAEFSIPAASPNLIESKSFKLYLNSLNGHRLTDTDALLTLMRQDLSAVAGAPVDIRLYPADAGPATGTLPGTCLDTLRVAITRYTPDADLLQASGQQGHGRWHSHLLKSNCPVTGQPDWGSLFIDIQGNLPTPDSLLAYVVSYRDHMGFHEHCVESIFADLWQQFAPQRLCVYARYVRRGGLDINPWRCSDATAAQSWPDMPRLARQ